MKDCVLITNEFPFRSGEPFLLNELPFLCATFENVYIFPINISDGEQIKYQLPSNVTVYPLGGLYSKFRYIYFLLKGIFSRTKELKINQKSIKRILTCMYARGRAMDVFEKIKKTISKNNITLNDTVVYSFWFTYQAIAAYKVKDFLLSKNVNAKAFSRAHGYDLYWERSASGFLPYQDVLLSKLDCTFSCSDMGKEYLTKKFPEFSEKVAVSKLGTKDHGIVEYTQSQKILVTCGNLIPLKRVSLFAEAFCKVSEKVTNCLWVCIGDGEEYDKIFEIVKNSDKVDRVMFKGRIPNDEVIDFYKKTSITYFCNVSTTEGIPVSVMEALSFGIPVIATNVGGTGELVSKDNGLLLDPILTSETLTEALLKMLSLNDNDYLKLRTNARKTWEKKASAEINYQNFCQRLIQ